jgi:hypothetical protein
MDVKVKYRCGDIVFVVNEGCDVVVDDDAVVDDDDAVTAADAVVDDR